ncbi:Paraquat-inducible protein B [Pseudomonas fluorescens]|uniref:Paraquat-inducible protein B n=1 Tax=Pseudomonas fluorescens TaxID=294 RepID=A0A8H2NSL4_PSEFL|nr:MlaD family protein [Pseudomonas fluorescens]CAG8872213.1 Intermembrane transport protein PqiB [Pseudomonas fluorescens]VVO37582.1 Paraquat-inducible protein B [Pseudomonas fluorescens]VVP07014.1 Paraquat-inducible protein B [Pseudomonas fluorescens]
MKSQATDGPQAPGLAPIKTRRFSVSLVWIVPIVAVLVGISLVVHSILQQGPTIVVTFKTGDGLTANKTEVKYRNVVIGHVSDVELSGDQKSVNATIKLEKQAESFTREDSQFWVVRPRIGAGGVSGIDTLLSGDYIGADIGQANGRAKNFKGLENPPPITYGEPGKRFTLFTQDLGSLDIGSPVYYRKIPVGQVVAYALDPDGKGVNIELFIHAPHDKYVTENTRFWNASGIDVNVGANGFAVKTESLSSLLVGGIAFRAPDYSPGDKPAAAEYAYELFEDQQTALAPPNGKPQYLAMRFDQALRGLKVDAPVEFLGVEIGKVVAVNLDYDETKRSFPINVGIVIYPQRLGQAHIKMLKALKHDPNDEAAGVRLIGTFIENGLRAQARTGNFLTGQLYIALDFYPKADKVAFDANARPVMIPTLPGSLEQLQEKLESMVDKINKLPIERIAGNLDGNLVELRKGMMQFNGKILPGVQTTLSDVSKTLETANTTLQSASSTLADDSPQREKLGQTLDELGRTSRSLRDLSDYLGRHPESLLRGRPNNAAPMDLQGPPRN